MLGEWDRIFFQLVVLPGSLAWDDFRVKFRTPLPLFNYVLECTKESVKFPSERNPNGGHEPHPLCLTLDAYLRYLATCVSMCMIVSALFYIAFIIIILGLRQVLK